MMTDHARADVLQIMKINRLTLIDSDSAQLRFAGQIGARLYEISILVIEQLPTVTIKQRGETIFSQTVESIDDLKIFLEERLHTFLTV